MKYLDRSLASPQENLALDEALLDEAESRGRLEVLRVWESTRYFVVVGYANRVDSEVNGPACRAAGVPILRRCTGGGTVLQGPGCLNYSLILAIDEDSTVNVSRTNTFVMERHGKLINALVGEGVAVRGHTDLALGGLKFSGNAQRRRKNHLIFHGTFLLDFNLALIGKYLRTPSQEPDYRGGRSHEEFLVNLKLPASQVKEALRREWQADGDLDVCPDFQPLVQSRYGCAEWNLKF